MEDFSCVPWRYQLPPNALLDREVWADTIRDELVSSPEKMYEFACSTRRRLPGELHRSMLLWSFDPEKSQLVEMYVSLSDHWESMAKWRAEFNQKMLLCDRLMNLSLAACFVVVFVIIVISGMKL